MYIFVLLLLLLGARACPDKCTCNIEGGEYRYSCRTNDGRFNLRAINDYFKIRCLAGSFSCDVVPYIQLFNNQSLSSATFSYCDVTDVACVLKRLGAAGTDKLIVNDPRGSFGVENVGGLNDVQLLVVMNATDQTTVPYDAIASLHTLKEFRLHGAPVTLLPSPQRTALQNLELSNVGIRTLPPGVFKSFVNLTELHLWGNLIEDIIPDAFEGLTKLRYLDLSRNPIRELRAHSFSGTPNLVRLHLVYTNITTIHTGAFSDLTQLTEIKLGMGRKNVTLNSKSLGGLPSLQVVDLQGTTLDDLPSDVFKGSKKIKHINLSDCNLVALKPHLFTDQKNLEELNLSSNRIKDLPAGIFQKMKKLKTLDLSGNFITDLPESTFSGLYNLLTLKLDRNQLSNITDNTFMGLRHLQNLSLSDNHLSLLQTPLGTENRSPFWHLSELQYLNLSRNGIEVVFDDWRTSLLHLKDIDLTWNGIQELRKKNTEFLSPGVTVRLGYNRVTTVQISDNLRSATIILNENPYYCDCNLYQFLSSIKQHKTNIILDSAVCLSPFSLNGLPLQELPLDSLSCPYNCPFACKCSVHPSSSSIYLDCISLPSIFPDPKQYNLTSIKLKVEHLSKFDNPNLSPEITSLNLSYAGIDEIPKLPVNLKELDLRSNLLTTIPEEISDMNVTLYLGDNPFECVCENKNDISALLKRSALIADGHNAMCVNGGPLLAVIPSNLCEVFWVEIVGGVIAGVALLSAIVVNLIYFCSDKIKRSIYNQGWNLFIYEEDVDGKKTDVLISYDDDQEKFVCNVLVPALKNKGYSVSARYKDWDIGDWIPAKVAETVEQSRRILVVLTKSYLNSMASLELEAAKLAENGQKRRRLVYIVREEDESLSGNFKDCLKWNDRRFWEKLAAEMPRKRPKAVEEKVNQATLNVLMNNEGKVTFECNKVI